MTFDTFMYYVFAVWLLMVISFAFFLIGRLVGYKEGCADSKVLYNIDRRE